MIICFNLSWYDFLTIILAEINFFKYQTRDTKAAGAKQYRDVLYRGRW